MVNSTPPTVGLDPFPHARECACGKCASPISIGNPAFASSQTITFHSNAGLILRINSNGTIDIGEGLQPGEAGCLVIDGMRAQLSRMLERSFRSGQSQAISTICTWMINRGLSTGHGENIDGELLVLGDQIDKLRRERDDLRDIIAGIGRTATEVAKSYKG